MAVFEEVGLTIVNLYQDFINFLPFWAQNFINLFLISLVIVVYGILIWKFYRFIAKKNLISLNLKKYNRSEHPLMAKTLAAVFYILEYLIILPFLVFFWFLVFTIFLILLTENLELQTILIISATVIAAIRMTSYYNEDLSRDIAKLLPFTILGVAVTQSTTFSFQKILTQVFAIPNFFGHIASYMLFIFIIELILRILETGFVATGMIEEETEIQQ
ncbi:hypothetical protein GW931_03130 [archaeon]|nr:hypothetical protein [archaeon]